VIEEEDVDRKPHPEGVDAAAARDQQTGAGLLDAEAGQAKEPRPAVRRDRDLSAQDPGAGQAGEAGG
jgi:hypothetical protein